jgi:hypothetical protein
MSIETFDRDAMSSPGGDWRAVADALAGALETTILRNPSLTARDWDRAHAALGQYERASGVPSRGRSEECLIEIPPA